MENNPPLNMVLIKGMTVKSTVREGVYGTPHRISLPSKVIMQNNRLSGVNPAPNTKPTAASLNDWISVLSCALMKSTFPKKVVFTKVAVRGDDHAAIWGEERPPSDSQRE
jgi:hypothetical protein